MSFLGHWMVNTFCPEEINIDSRRDKSSINCWWVFWVCVLYTGKRSLQLEI